MPYIVIGHNPAFSSEQGRNPQLLNIRVFFLKLIRKPANPKKNIRGKIFLQVTSLSFYLKATTGNPAS